MTVPERAWEGVPRMRAERDELQRRVYELEDALAFYADPDTYFAIAMIPDPPCGAFITDVSDVNTVEEPYRYNRPMPGALAREILGVEIPQQRLRDWGF